MSRFTGKRGTDLRRYHRQMKTNTFRHFVVATMIAVSCAVTFAQQSSLSAADKQRRIDTENELQSLAIVERKVMMAMPDGVRGASWVSPVRLSSANARPLRFGRRLLGTAAVPAAFSSVIVFHSPHDSHLPCQRL